MAVHLHPIAYRQLIPSVSVFAGDGTQTPVKVDQPAEVAIATRPVEVPDAIPAAWRDSAIVYHLRAPCSEPAPEDWAVIESEFVWVTSVYLSHIGNEMMGVPQAKLDEDILYIYTLRKGIVSCSCYFMRLHCRHITGG